MHPSRPFARLAPAQAPAVLPLFVALLAAATSAPPPSAVAGPAVPSDPAFEALLTDGTTVAGRLVRVDPGAGLTLAPADAPERTIPVAQLVKLARSASAPPGGPEGATVLLPGDDRLAHCQVGAADDATVRVVHPTLGPLAVPLDSLVGIVFQRPGPAEAAGPLEGRVRAEGHDAERLWLANGDRLDGLFAGLTERELRFQPPTGKLDLPRAGVLALGFDPGQVADRPPAGPSGEFALLDGTRLTLPWGQVRFERGQVVGPSRFGAEVRIPIGQVARVRVVGSSVRYLSDREADRAAYQSYLGPTRPYRRNASVAGPPIRLGGETYDRGLGTQSRTLLAYKLDARDRRFQATVGLDESAGPLGNVRFRVVLDGKPAYESPAMGPGDPPRVVDIPVLGGKVVVLITEFGDRGDVQDSADWAEARLIQDPLPATDAARP